jgi:hypothetical protein
MELSRTGNANLSPELSGLRPSAPVPRIPQAGGGYLGLPFPHGGPHFFRTIEPRLRRPRPHKRLPLLRRSISHVRSLPLVICKQAGQTWPCCVVECLGGRHDNQSILAKRYKPYNGRGGGERRVPNCCLALRVLMLLNSRKVTFIFRCPHTGRDVHAWSEA